MEDVERILHSNGIKLVLLDISKDGYYLDEVKTMVVNKNLSEEKMKRVVLHELKHALDHSELTPLYDRFTFHAKMESEASDFVIDYLIEENDGYYNYSHVLEEFKLGLGWQPK
ncbi:ImmA/IrrE family metallo-endopeptidase [Enterococcus avium]|uniref:ImmA/IrrE family metallo-endopeptidase n=1 Tax=Enterococcus avium TaxID=33945 RepID=UPI0032196C89